MDGSELSGRLPLHPTWTIVTYLLGFRSILLVQFWRIWPSSSSSCLDSPDLFQRLSLHFTWIVLIYRIPSLSTLLSLSYPSLARVRARVSKLDSFNLS